MKNIIVIFSILLLTSSCKNQDKTDLSESIKDLDTLKTDRNLDFYFGADLSYVNQILDHGGVYKDGGVEKDPYEIFANRGTNLVRLRLWHHPVWTKEVYGTSGSQLYNDLLDVEKAIAKSKAQGMEVLLDFHYSDNWADPGTQEVPLAWRDISNIEDLKDSVYNYTFRVLSYLEEKGLMPEMVQVGNETNCGMMLDYGNDNFPNLNVCEKNWANMGLIVNSAIDAIRSVDSGTVVMLHVADPKNIDWWFEHITSQGKVSDFEMIGISYYPIWHNEIPLSNMQSTLEGFISKFGKEVMIVETAYPWTAEAADGYNNIFGSDGQLSGYPFSPAGQVAFLSDLRDMLINAGVSGMVYWEPGWITSNMKDQWNTGSSWENCAFFDFEGNANSAFDYIPGE